MKTAVVFLSTILLTAGNPKVKTWPLNELYDAMTNLPKNSSVRVAANEALIFIYDHIRRDYTQEFGHAIVPSPSGADVWTKNELEKEAQNITLSPVLGFYAQPALKRLSKEDTAQMLVPAMDISIWTASDISDALNDPTTNPILLPYLKKAENKINGSEKYTEVTLVTPINLIHVKNPPFYPLGYVFQSIYI